jgi:hypothetical protein
VDIKSGGLGDGGIPSGPAIHLLEDQKTQVQRWNYGVDANRGM